MRDRTPEPDLALLTHRVTAALQRALRTAPTDRLDERIGPRHRAVLSQLGQPGSRAVDLARRTGQHKQVIGTIVDELEQFGYVRREPDPTDRRGKLIVPTALGLRQAAATEAALAGIERRLAEAVGQRRYEQFKRTFEQIAGILIEECP
jgi:DNA-binding MarR family transcriptional regulator